MIRITPPSSSPRSLARACRRSPGSAATSRCWCSRRPTRPRAARARRLHRTRRSSTSAAHFDTSLLRRADPSLSLFAERKLVDLRLAGKPTKELGEALRLVRATPLGDDCRAARHQRPARAGNRRAPPGSARSRRAPAAGAAEGRARPPAGWLAQRLAPAGPARRPRRCSTLIADRAEGNLLAAHQEMQRLGAAAAAGRARPRNRSRRSCWTRRATTSSAWSTPRWPARPRGRCAMLDGLRAEDAPLPLLVWALADACGACSRLQPGARRRPAGAVGAAQRRHLRQARGGLQPGARGDSTAAPRLRLLRETAHLDRMAKGVGGLPDSGEPAAFAAAATPKASGPRSSGSSSGSPARGARRLTHA